MNDLVIKSFGSADAVRNYAGALRNSTRAISDGNERDLLKCSDKDGTWAFGQESTLVERDDLWAINPVTIKHGYIAFDSSEVALTIDEDRAEIVLPVTQPLPEYDSLPELSAKPRKGRDPVKWRFQMALEMVCVDGPNKGAEVVFKPTSMGGLRCVRMMVEEIARRFDEDHDTHVPVVELDSRSYMNRTYGKEIFNAQMHIVEWYGLDDDTFAGKKAAAKPAKAIAKAARADEEDDQPRRGARTARAAETDRRGEPVDQRRRRAAPADEVAEDADEVVEEAPRRRRAAPADEVAEAAPRGRRGRDPIEDADVVEEDVASPRGRRGRDEEDEHPARDGAVRGRRAAVGGRR